ncbi:hypothetical protein FRC00_000221, partial [Tulasnella sp. 408]
MSTTLPSSHNKYIAADDDSDDDIDESALPSYGTEDVLVPSPAPGKGKGRPQDTLASPSGQQPLSGNIGSSGAGTSAGGGGGGATRGPTRQKIGSIQVETRYSGVDTLDEPVLTTISLCVLGYCIFPLVVAALISTFFHKLFIRGPVTLAAWAWSVW